MNLCPFFVGLLLATHAQAGTTASQPFEMRFQFEQNGTPSVHTFILKWANAESNLRSIDVLLSDSDQVLQTISVPQDSVHLMWRDLVEKPHEIKDKIIEFADYNFDKYGDLRLTRVWPYQPGNKFYLIWLFDIKKNKYVQSEELSKLPAPTPDDKTKRISSLNLGGFGGGEYTQKAFSISPSGHLKIETKVTQTVRDPVSLSFLREVRLRVNGELQRVCKIRVPAEGKPKLIWGDKEQCEPFQMKGPPTIFQNKGDLGVK